LFDIVEYYASLSRRLSGDWPNLVSQYQEGNIELIETAKIIKVPKSYLPKLPKTRQSYKEKIKKDNEESGKIYPWARGLYESIIAVNVIYRQNLYQKNRICLIILDSTLEIGFKEYLVSIIKIGKSKFRGICENRISVQEEIKKHTSFDDEYWNKADYYYRIRCDLIHQKAMPTIIDEDLIDYWEVVEYFLKELFGLIFNY